MARPPRDSGENIFGRGLWVNILSRGCIIGVTTLIVFSLVYLKSADLNYAQSMALATLVIAQLIYVFECRSEYLPVWENNPAGNLLLIMQPALLFFF